MLPLLRALAKTPVPALIPVLLGIISTLLGLLSFYLAVQNYRRKAGAYIRGAITPCQSRDCDDDYIAEVVLENLKDRAVSIFGIYVRIGYNLYLRLQEFDDQPLILKPFETYVKAFGPVEFYVVNMNKIAVRGLLSNTKVKKRIFLSTSEGKYKVKTPVERWSPVYECFRNYFTGLIQPIRSIHREQAIGGNIKFVVDFVKSDDAVESIQLRADDHRLRIFKDFRLTPESLATKESLEQFLHKQRSDGKLSCKDVVVYDIEAWRSRTRDDYKDSSFKAEPVGFLEYYVLGKLATLARSWRVNRNNARLLKAHKTKPLTPPVTTGSKGELTRSDDSDNSESAAGSRSI